MIYENKNGFYHKTYKYHIAIGILFFLLVLGTAISMGASIQSNRRYRAELERSIRLEQSVREQEQRIKSTSTELGELIQSSDERIKSALTGTEDLRKTMQFLENEYNSMFIQLSSINNSLNNTEPN